MKTVGISSHCFFMPLYYLARNNKNLKIIYMNELIERLTKEAGLDAAQAQQAVATIAAFVKEKFPMLGGAVDQIFSAGNKED